MRTPTLALFVIASFLLAITPGPGVLFLINRTLSRGRNAGLASLTGLGLGSLGNLIMASLGLAVLLAVSALAFTVVKLAGAAYLIFLGVQALRSKPVSAHAEAPAHTVSRLMRDGFLVGLLNPKTALFFAAFLPQFIDPHGRALTQSLVYGTTFIAIAACTDTLYVLSTAALGPAVMRRLKPGRWGRYLSASTFLGLGLYVAFTPGRSVK